MEAIYAGLITLLFSAWVWDLKTQVGHQEGAQLIHGTNQADDGERLETRDHSAPARKPRKRSVQASTGRIERENGVPTWVIE